VLADHYQLAIIVLQVVLIRLDLALDISTAVQLYLFVNNKFFALNIFVC